MRARKLTLAVWLKVRRTERQISQEDAARELGVSTGVWRIWERGGYPVKIRDARRLARWAGVPDEEVLEMIKTSGTIPPAGEG